MTLIIGLSAAEHAAISETADLNNSGVCDWAKRTLLNATTTNDEKRLRIRREIESNDTPKQGHLYIANPVKVTGLKITDVQPLTGLEGSDVELIPNGLVFTISLENGTEALVTSSMAGNQPPVVGDYFTVQTDGYAYVNPKDVFERKYRLAE